jgi:hypothetical protein
MSVPKHLWRFPTAAAIRTLAQRFGLRNDPGMQDWEWQVSDATRLDEFLRAYEEADLSDDERFVLMEIILQSFEDLGHTIVVDPRWHRTLELIDQNIDLHAHSVWYWSALESEDADDQWVVTPFLRRIVGKHRDRLERP